MEDNCFMMRCWFLLYNNMNQLYVYIYPLPLEPPSHPFLSHPSRSSQIGSTFFFFLIIFYWDIVALLCVDFCCTTSWISHVYTYICSLVSLPTTSPFHLSRSSQSTELNNLCSTTASDAYTTRRKERTEVTRRERRKSCHRWILWEKLSRGLRPQDTVASMRESKLELRGRFD